VKHKLLAALGMICGLCLLVAPTRAHHSFTAEFDASKWFSVKGTITRLEWINPHVYFYLDVKDEAGTVVPYSFESRPPGLLRTAGVVKTMFNVGDEVTMDAYVAKDGSKHFGYVKAVHFADGHTVILSSDPTEDEKKNP
jgi:hypothetical protein